MIEKEIIIIDKTLVVLEALYKDKLIKKIPLLRILIDCYMKLEVIMASIK
ncbi:hypothetical protein [Clostridium saccharoperbutylacetonicum]